MADNQNVTAGIKGVQALADAQREKQILQSELGKANSKIAAMEAERAAAKALRNSSALTPGPSSKWDATGAGMRNQAAAMYSAYQFPIGPQPFQIPTIGAAGASSKWDATGAGMRSAQAQEQAAKDQEKAITNASKEAEKGISDLGTSAVKVAGAMGMAMTAAHMLANALSGAEKAKNERQYSREERRLAIAETTAAFGGNAEDEKRLSNVMTKEGRLTRDQKTALLKTAQDRIAGDPTAARLNKQTDLEDIIGKVESGSLSYEQAQKIISSDQSWSVGSKIRETISPRSPMSESGKEAEKILTEKNKVTDRSEGNIDRGGKKTGEQILNEIRGKAGIELQNDITSEKEKGNTLAGDMVGGNFFGPFIRELIIAIKEVSQTSTGDLSTTTLEKAKKTQERMGANDEASITGGVIAKKISESNSTKVPSPVEGR